MTQQQETDYKRLRKLEQSLETIIIAALCASESGEISIYFQTPEAAQECHEVLRPTTYAASLEGPRIRFTIQYEHYSV